MERFVEWFQNPVNRRWIYGVILAGSPLLVVAGLVSDTEVAQWTNFAAALLGVTGAGLAFPNTPTHPGQEEYVDEAVDGP